MFWRSKEDQKANSQQQQQQQQYEDIPIITDAQVVDEDVVPASAPPSASAPPAMNPNYKGKKPAPTMAGSAPGAYQITAPPAAQLNQPINMHVNTHMVAASDTNMVKPKIYTQLGRNATGLQCPHCGRQTVTVVEDYVGLGTVICVIILAILFWPLCWLPLCVPSCKRTHHYCGHPECQKKVGETRVCA